MATTEEGKKLTEKFRLSQAKLAKYLEDLVWALVEAVFDFSDISGSATAIGQSLTQEVLDARRQSMFETQKYLRDFHRAEHGEDLDFEFDKDQMTRENITATLITAAVSAGFQIQRQSQEGLDAGYLTVEKAEKAAKVRVADAVSGEATTRVLDGGRETTLDFVGTKNGPKGYVRVPDSDPCPFCAMLAARGYVGGSFRGNLLRSDAFKGNTHKYEKRKGWSTSKKHVPVHDHCCCVLEPVYEVGGKVILPDINQKLAEEWAQVACGYSRDQSFSAWQSWRRSGILPDDYDGPLEGKRARRRPKTGFGKDTRRVEVKRKKTKPHQEWGKDDYKMLIGSIKDRIKGIEDQIHDAEVVGQEPGDPVLTILEDELKTQRDRLEKYRKHVKETWPDQAA